MTGPYTVQWGIIGGPEWPESRTEDHLDDALHVAQANGGTIFNARGNQLTAEDIAAHQHPYRRAAEDVVGTLMAGLNSQHAGRLELYTDAGVRCGSWSVESAVKAVEQCLEGSGL
jgi:hypothetical protein